MQSQGAGLAKGSLAQQRALGHPPAVVVGWPAVKEATSVRVCVATPPPTSYHSYHSPTPTSRLNGRQHPLRSPIDRSLGGACPVLASSQAALRAGSVDCFFVGCHAHVPTSLLLASSDVERGGAVERPACPSPALPPACCTVLALVTRACDRAGLASSQGGSVGVCLRGARASRVGTRVRGAVPGLLPSALYPASGCFYCSAACSTLSLSLLICFSS